MFENNKDDWKNFNENESNFIILSLKNIKLIDKIHEQNLAIFDLEFIIKT